MAKWLLMVESNSSDVAREGEFNDWYNKIHLPDVLQTPGFIRAARYEGLYRGWCMLGISRWMQR